MGSAISANVFVEIRFGRPYAQKGSLPLLARVVATKPALALQRALVGLNEALGAE